jgi:hypothetical protein
VSFCTGFFSSCGSASLAALLGSIHCPQNCSPSTPARQPKRRLDGTFVVRNVIPGQYTIIAVEDAWGFEWLKPGILSRYLPHGQTLNIGELMHRTVYLPEPLEAQPR